MYPREPRYTCVHCVLGQTNPVHTVSYLHWRGELALYEIYNIYSMGLEKLWHDFPPILNSSWKILGHNKPCIFPYNQMFSAFFIHKYRVFSYTTKEFR